MRSISLSSPSVYDTSASSGSSTKYHASYEYMTPKMRKRTAPPRVTARRAKKVSELDLEERLESRTRTHCA